MAERTFDITKTLKDAAYVTLGFGVIAFQRAQVRRRELQRQFESQLTETREQVERLTNTIEDRLPTPAKDLVRQTRKQLSSFPPSRKAA